MTHSAVLEPARQRTLALVAPHAGPVLLLHDATERDYTTLTSLCDDLG